MANKQITNENTTAISTEAKDVDLVQDFNNDDNGNYLICYHFKEGRTGQVEQYQAINSPDKRLADMEGKTIKVVGFIVHVVEIVSQVTGVLTPTPRIILIDNEGVSYECVSSGIYNALKKLHACFPFPNYEQPLEISITSEKGKKGFDFLTLNLVG